MKFSSMILYAGWLYPAFVIGYTYFVGFNEILFATLLPTGLYIWLLHHHLRYKHHCIIFWITLIYMAFQFLFKSQFLRDNWLNSLYINLGSSILIIVFIDFLVQKRNSEENDERLARIEKKLDEIKDLM